MRTIITALTFCMSLFFSACEKDELPVESHSRGDVITTQLELGSTYNKQVYFSLSSNTIVSQNEKMAWDLGFEASKEGWHIKLNTGRGGAIAQTTHTNLSEVKTEKELTWKRDAPSGNLDSTAISDYRSNNLVYVVDRGYNAVGDHTGYIKFQLKQLDAQQYQITFADLNSNEKVIRIVEKNEAVNYVCFSFDSKSVVPIEPPKESWDLFFGHYTHIFYDPYTPYLVTGVLLNPNGVKAVRQKELPYKDISFENSSDLALSQQADTIGYTWKVFNFKQSSYTVFSNFNWVIQDAFGRKFKFHFIDFYNKNGEKGAPKFEFQEL